MEFIVNVFKRVRNMSKQKYLHLNSYQNSPAFCPWQLDYGQTKELKDELDELYTKNDLIDAGNSKVQRDIAIATAEYNAAQAGLRRKNITTKESKQKLQHFQKQKQDIEQDIAKEQTILASLEIFLGQYNEQIEDPVSPIGEAASLNLSSLNAMIESINLAEV